MCLFRKAKLRSHHWHFKGKKIGILRLQVLYQTLQTKGKNPYQLLFLIIIYLRDSREIQVENVDLSGKIYLQQSCSVITSSEFQFLRDEITITKLKGTSHKFALMKKTGQCFALYCCYCYIKQRPEQKE